MPNHIQNKLRIIGNDKEVKKVLQSISSNKDGEKMQIDFNKIKPMPEGLNITSGSLGEMAHELLFGIKERKFFPIDLKERQKRFAAMDIERQKEAVELAIQYQFNLTNYGATTWYDWACNNWGTKWNAYSQNDGRNTKDTIYFQTAWSAPVELIRALSEKFPNVEFELTYADEDTGSNTGIFTFKEGETIGEDVPDNQSMQAYEIYFELNPESRDDFKLVGNTYEYIDSEEN